MEMDEARIITSIKSYHELSKAVENRSKILSDKNFLNMATLLISEKRARIVNRMTSVMLTLTEREEDAALLKDAKAFRTAIGNASEQDFPPVLIHNLLSLASRIQISSELKKRKECSKPVRRFVHHKSMQFSFIITPFNEDIKMSVEKKCLSGIKGVISISMDNEKNAIQLRVLPSVSSQIIVNSLFDCGAEKVERLVKNELGQDEKWELSREEVNAPLLPTYIEEIDPSKEGVSVVPSGHIKSNGSWLSSITSMFW
ncbi:hypothetical protein PMAYCL1PPCAC_23812 [Pristionchus mayeri]|uniref:Uncharacterized protein n=1 Tax=Pristionchus mayeri TaxID=1317129 RepID=A0AAN5D0X7_9BILA|nr:hypothetical protein PMAYCL1PPCAC_23812 [Pristionchus mayeri]